MSEQYETEAEFLAHYDPGAYPRPSVTADVVVLTIRPNKGLCVLLVRRGNWPHKGKWALPGGFLEAGKESVDQAAARELKEETGLPGLYLKQLATFSDPGRDPRGHMISVAYTALVPAGRLVYRAGDDASDAGLFGISYEHGTLVLADGDARLQETDLAFDHAEIIKAALDRLRGRVSYEPDAFELLADKSGFTVYELRHVFELVLGKSLDSANFRKMFMRSYFKTGRVNTTGRFRGNTGHRPAALYRLNPDGKETT